MKDIQFSDRIKEHKHFSKIDENTWLVQSNPKSRCQAYYVTILPHAIVMYGDYDGVIVKPHEAGKENLIGWMAGATDLRYFCEKGINGNRYHQTKEYSEREARKELAWEICSRYELYDLSKYLEDIFEKGTYDNNELLEKCSLEKESHPDSYDHEEFDKMCKEIDCVLDGSIETSHDFYNLVKELRSDYDYRFEEVDPTDYHSQIRWQQECLLWWANYLLQQNKKEDGIPPNSKELGILPTIL